MITIVLNFYLVLFGSTAAGTGNQGAVVIPAPYYDLQSCQQAGDFAKGDLYIGFVCVPDRYSVANGEAK